jgi:hypothetical protein
MLQFQSYPIYIVYSLHRQKAVRPLWNGFAVAKDLALDRAHDHLAGQEYRKARRDLEVAGENSRMKDALSQWDLVDDLEGKYKREIAAYQNAISKVLTTISRTSIGKQLLSMIGGQKVYIIPQESDGPARTGSYSDEQGGGIRITFSPEYFTRVAVGPNSVGSAVEDTLFHELVHAMRISNNRYFPRNLSSPDFNHNSEEFIAEQLANVYHSSRGTSDFLSTYNGGYLRKKQMYEYLESSAEFVYAIKFCLDTEPLAKFAAMLKQPAYNPFRDYKELEDKSYLRMFTSDVSDPFKTP